MRRLSLFLLGPPRIERNGKVVKFETRKTLALLVYLALARPGSQDNSHTRDALATLLWPESDHAHARAALRRALSTLKKAIGAEWLEADRERLALKRIPGLWVDVNHFQDCLATCRSHGHPSDEVCPACLPCLSEAVELYRDDFMAGFTLPDSPSFDEWQRFNSEHIRSELSAALERLAHGYSTQGKFEPAITYARRQLTLDPLYEPAHRQLMRLYARSNQRAAALHQYETCVQVLERELALPPQDETTQLYQRISSSTVAAQQPSRPLHLHNLPHQSTPLVGRDKELAEIGRLLEGAQCRLLTLTGLGGIGKTHLAIQAAAERIGAFPDGIFFVPLAAVRSTDTLVPTIADALKFSLRSSGNLRAQLLDYLRDKAMLLVLDNMEHLLASTELLGEILENAAEIKILTTSRECLNIKGEWVLEVQGLRFPDAECSDEIEAYSAVQLFAQSARRAHHRFQFAQEQSAVARICRLVEGIPLAIEMASAWVSTLSCTEIANEIERSLSFLTSLRRDIPERHHTLMATFDYSWRLLLKDERRALAKLSVFQGGFTKAAAERVTGTSLFILSALMHKSFLRRDTVGRYEMLEILRQYAEEQLASEREEALNRHCEYYAEFLCQREKRLKGKGQKQALEDIGAEIDNVRAAWRWMVENGKREEIAVSLDCLYLFYEMRSWFHEGAEALSKAIEASGGYTPGEYGMQQDALFWRIRAHQGWFYLRLARFKEGQELMQGSLSVFRRLGASKEIASVLNHLGVAAAMMGEYSEARQQLQESLTTCKEIGDRYGMASSLNNLGHLAILGKKYDEAKQLLWESITIRKEIGDRYRMASSLGNLGITVEALGEYDVAKQLHQECVALFREIGNRWAIANALNNLGFVLCMLEERQNAWKCFRESLYIAIDMQAVDVILAGLVGVATLLVKDGKKEQALELVAHLLCHPAILACPDVEDRAEQLLSNLKTLLSPQTFATFQERGKARKFDYYVQLYRLV